MWMILKPKLDDKKFNTSVDKKSKILNPNSKYATN